MGLGGPDQQASKGQGHPVQTRRAVAKVYGRLVEKYPKIQKGIKFSDAGNPQMDTHTLNYLFKKLQIPEITSILKYRDNLKLFGQVQKR